MTTWRAISGLVGVLEHKAASGCRRCQRCMNSSVSMAERRTVSVLKPAANAPMTALTTALQHSTTTVPLLPVRKSERIHQHGMMSVARRLERSNTAVRLATTVSAQAMPTNRATTPRFDYSMSKALETDDAHGSLSHHRLSTVTHTVNRRIRYFIFVPKHVANALMTAKTIHP